MACVEHMDGWRNKPRFNRRLLGDGSPRCLIFPCVSQAKLPPGLLCKDMCIVYGLGKYRYVSLQSKKSSYCYRQLGYVGGMTAPLQYVERNMQIEYRVLLTGSLWVWRNLCNTVWRNILCFWSVASVLISGLSVLGFMDSFLRLSPADSSLSWPRSHSGLEALGGTSPTCCIASAATHRYLSWTYFLV